MTAGAAELDAALPQTQCRRCGFADCAAYARALAAGEAAINRCPPGGAEGVARLARLTGHAPLPLDPECGHEGPRGLAVIDEAWCIGCTLCIQACPVDCIIGSARHMHTVIDTQCTGCELCVPACPVDCIRMQPVSGSASGWQAWAPSQAAAARASYDQRQARQLRARHALAQDRTRVEGATDRQAATSLDSPVDPRRAAVEAALARARARRGENAPR